MKTFRVEPGLRDAHRERAATLYWEAFGEKLGRLLGPDERAHRFFTATIHGPSLLSAIDDDGTLLGVAAFKEGDAGFCKANTRDLFAHYGLGTLWRLPLLAALERQAPADTLQMDGICVGSAARGRGVGSALLRAIGETARQRDKRKVTLDVIDRNTRAKALYERMGFEAVTTESTGPFRHLLGFETATRMVWTLHADS